MLIPVILAGGYGKRLWPASRQSYPKQMLSFTNGKSLLQNTVFRLNTIRDIQDLIIVCSEEQRFLLSEQLDSLGVKNYTIILESTAKNTASAVALALVYCMRRYNNPNLLIAPADHSISPLETFLDAINLGCAAANQGKIITYGITPKTADTEYGYIKYQKTANEHNAYPILQYVEKPNRETAEKFLQTQEYFWNSGLFLFKASVVYNEYLSYASTIMANCSLAMENSSIDGCFIRPESTYFDNNETLAFDYAIMEKTTKGVVIPLKCQWSDLGTWERIWEASDKDNNNNGTVGDVVLHDVSNCYVSSCSRLVVVSGVHNQVIIETPDAILIADRATSNNLKNIVELLEKQKRKETQLGVKVNRPWGYYETLTEGENYKTKKIVIKPGASISMQLHHKRSEHWVVVKGTAKIVKGGEEYTLTPNMSIYIPAETKHRISNFSNEMLEVIEVQTGSYLGEDDIVRFEDGYGRINVVTSSTCEEEIF